MTVSNAGASRTEGAQPGLGLSVLLGAGIVAIAATVSALTGTVDEASGALVVPTLAYLLLPGGAVAIDLLGLRAIPAAVVTLVISVAFWITAVHLARRALARRRARAGAPVAA